MATVPITDNIPDITDNDIAQARERINQAVADEPTPDDIWDDIAEENTDNGEVYIKWADEELGYDEEMLVDENGKPTASLAIFVSVIAVPVAIVSGLAGWGLRALIKH